MHNPTSPFNIDSHSKLDGAECHLPHAVSYSYSTYLAFPEQVHRAHIPATGSPRSLERKEAHPELDESFHARDGRGIDEVVEVCTLPQFTRAWHDPSAFSSLKVFGQEGRNAPLMRTPSSSFAAVERSQVYPPYGTSVSDRMSGIG